MPSEVTSQWREKAIGFLSSSGLMLKKAGQSAGTFVGHKVKDTGENVIDAAFKVKSLVKNRWAILQKATKKTIDNIDNGPKGVANTKVFGIPIEATLPKQQSRRPVPQILVRCAEFLVSSGLNSKYLFKAEGNRKVLRCLISLYNQDWNASFPEYVTAVDVAALVKCYLVSLPEPLTTFVLYHEIINARSSLHDLRSILEKLPNVNYMTLEFVTALLLRVSQKSLLNKMDAHSLSVELAPAIMWKKDDSRVDIPNHLSYTSKVPTKPVNCTPNKDAWIYLSDYDEEVHASVQIPLDEDRSPPDYGAIEVVQRLIEHHNTIFADANLTTWR